jgi:hypothetical protein
MSGTAVDDALVADLARLAVERTAPEELPLFRPTSEAFFEDPDAVPRRGGRDELLGFGVEAAVVLVTPVALSVARDVARFVADQLRSRLAQEGEGAVQRALDRVFKRDAKPDAADAPAAAAAAAATPELTDEELERVRAIALEKAQQLRLPPDRAGLLADAIVGGLATG